MDLAELDLQERIVLAAVLERIVGSDARVSDEEHAVIRRVADALGVDAYRAAVAEADRRFGDPDELWIALPVVHRPAARELILATLLEAAVAGGVDGREAALLERVSRAWHLRIRTAAPTGTR